jgi:HEAT repeat protein
MGASATLHLKEAIPFLLDQYRAGYETQAGGALDAIRRYYDRIASFESFQGGAEERKGLAKLLEDPDPEIRRAAVLSIAALGDKDALPRLVKFAKEEKDARVRTAALEAVERLARSASSTPPSPAPPPAPAMSDDGR